MFFLKFLIIFVYFLIIKMLIIYVFKSIERVLFICMCVVYLCKLFYIYIVNYFNIRFNINVFF